MMGGSHVMHQMGGSHVMHQMDGGYTKHQMDGVHRRHQMEASKWLQIQVLLDDEEMRKLFEALGDFQIYRTGVVLEDDCSSKDRCILKDEFLQIYHDYILALKGGVASGTFFFDKLKIFRAPFSTAFSVTPDTFATVSTPNNKKILRTIAPVIQLQMHRLGYSEIENKFRPMIHGQDSISWGLQFSYPQLMMDQKTHQPVKVDISDRFPNTILFKALHKWIRTYSIPTPFVVNGQVMNVAIRIGKECFSWINRHPDLVYKKIEVKNC